MADSLHQAVEFRVSALRYLAVRALAPRWSGASLGRLGMLRPVLRPEPSIRHPDWVRVRPLLSGICGSDLTLVTAQDSPSLEPTCSSVFVPGHEVVGVVDAVGAAVTDLQPGTRVVMDAVLHCAIRGISPVCAACQAKRFSLCENILDGCVAPGLFAGYNSDLGGSWGELFLAHRSMLFAVPDSIADEDAVLLEPFCSALHPVLSHPPAPRARAVVFGCGTLGLLTIAALRATGFRGRILAVAKHAFQADLARRWGADEIVAPTSRLLRDIADRTEAKYLKGTLGPALLLGGPEIVYDCVGNSWSMQQALQMTRGGGKVVLIGIASKLSVDSSSLWFKELGLFGSCGSGGEVPGKPGRRVMDEAISLAAAGTIRLCELITHTFPIADYRGRPLARRPSTKRRSGALKVAFDFRQARK